MVVLSLSEVVESGHSWKHTGGQGVISLVSQQGFIWLLSGAWRLPQILYFSEIIPLLLQGPRKFMELLIFLVCFPCHVIVVAFGLSLSRSCSLGHGRVSRPFGPTEALGWRSWAVLGCSELPF